MITGLLLAAGAGQRFGGNKLAARLSSGEAVALRTATRLAPAVDNLLVIVRSGQIETKRLLDEAGFITVPCADAALGMAHTLACGLRASADSSAWLIGLADMPMIRTDTVMQLVAAYRESGAIIVPRRAGQSGHPVIFPARYGPELLDLRGDHGAKAVLNAHVADIHYVDTDDDGVRRDIDTPADLAALESGDIVV